jgi:eukaryotic-like serine/threonine-protein kinase
MTGEAQFQRLGKYELHQALGEGAMGTVWKAYDTVLRRFVALKLMAPSVSRTAEMRDRFFREAHAAGALQHPNVITIYDLGEAKNQLFIAMELLEGRDLADVIAAQDPLPLERKLDVLIEMLDGLDYAHRQGVIHRDIKPANVRITTDGRVKLLDFGIARLETSELTRSGALVGTPTYMAPELITNGPVTPSTDVFAAGCLLYEFLAYTKPFIAETLQGVLYQVLTTDPPPLRTLAPSIPAALERVVVRAISKNPEDRFQTASDMRKNLLSIRHALSGGEDVDTQILGEWWSRIPAPLLRLLRTVPLKWNVVVVGAMVGVVAFLIWQVTSEPDLGGPSSTTAVAAAPAAGAPDSLNVVSAAVRALRDTALAARDQAVKEGAVQNDVAAVAAGMGALNAGDRAAQQGAEARAAPHYTEATSAFRRALREVRGLRRVADSAVSEARPIVRALGTGAEGAAAFNSLARAESLFAAQDYRNVVVFARAARDAGLDLGVAPPSPQPAEPRRAIEVLLGDLTRAIASERVPNIRALYPRISEAEARGWSDFFQSANDLRATYRIERFTAQRSTATGRVRLTYRFLPAGGGAPREVDQQFEMTFSTTPQGWRIATFRARR